MQSSERQPISSTTNIGVQIIFYLRHSNVKAFAVGGNHALSKCLFRKPSQSYETIQPIRNKRWLDLDAIQCLIQVSLRRDYVVQSRKRDRNVVTFAPILVDDGMTSFCEVMTDPFK